MEPMTALTNTAIIGGAQAGLALKPVTGTAASAIYHSS
jgi:hypothetical protein